MPALPAALHQALQVLHPHAEVRDAEPLHEAWTSRRSWRVRVDDAWCVLKPARDGAQGVLRAQHEFAAMQWAHGHALAPRPLSFDGGMGWLSYAWAPGTTPWEDCAKVMACLGTLHALPLPAWPRFDPLQAAADSVRALDSVAQVTLAQRAWLAERLERAREALERAGPGALAPCHNDVQPFNVVRGARPLLLDWEDAALGDPLWDLASWTVSLDLPRPAHPQQQGGETGRLAAWCRVAEVYFLAWGLLRPPWCALEMERLRTLMR